MYFAKRFTNDFIEKNMQKTCYIVIVQVQILFKQRYRYALILFRHLMSQNSILMFYYI